MTAAGGTEVVTAAALVLGAEDGDADGLAACDTTVGPTRAGVEGTAEGGAAGTTVREGTALARAALDGAALVAGGVGLRVSPAAVVVGDPCRWATTKPPAVSAVTTAVAPTGTR